MADKQVDIFVVDLGRSMGRTHNGRSQSDLDYSLDFVYDKIANAMYTGRKTLFTGVLGFRTDHTKNHMQEEGGYENINIIQDIRNMVMPDLRQVASQLVAQSTDRGDALSAVILAVDMVLRFCKQLKYIKNIFLVTNGTGPIDGDDIESTAEQFANNNINLTVLGVDFDDAEYGFKEEDKDFRKQENESNLRKLVELSRGTFGTMAEAVEGLQIPHVKPVKPVASYKGQLRLGDPERYQTAMTIDIERYPKVMPRKPPTASSFVIRDGIHPSQQASSSTNGAMAPDVSDLATVRRDHTYTITDPDAPNGTRDVAREELAKGYAYGRTAVHISESEENITKYPTYQSYHILGFVPIDNVERYMFLGLTHMLVPAKANAKAALALSSMIRAMYELDVCAVGRLVKKDMAPPELKMLFPEVTSEIECLIENDLPFAEDLRSYRFPPLDRIVTVSGRELTSHRNLPSGELQSAIDAFVDGMNLVTTDGENNKNERFPIDETYSPLFHSVESAVKYRAVHPERGLPERLKITMEPSKQPEDLLDTNAEVIKRLIKVADVKPVPPRVKGKRRYRDREVEKPISGLDVDALLAKGKEAQQQSAGLQIDPLNAIPEFTRFMNQDSTSGTITDVVKQMGVVVENLITKSSGDQHYDQAIEILSTVREEIIEYDFADVYNDLVRQLKRKIENDELGIDRKEFWWRVRRDRLGLVRIDESTESKTGEQEADNFLRLNPAKAKDETRKASVPSNTKPAAEDMVIDTDSDNDETIEL